MRPGPYLSPTRRKAMCRRFNERHPVGSTIRVWTGVMGDGPGKLVQVVAPGAYVLSGHTAVVQVSGGAGCVCLTHVGRVDPGEIAPLGVVGERAA